MAANLAGDFAAEAVADAGVKITTTATAYVAAALPVATAAIEGTGSARAVYQLARSYMPQASALIIGKLANAAINYARKNMKSNGMSASSGKTLVKKRTRVSNIPTMATEVERPLTLAKLGKSPNVKSVWSSLRDMVNSRRRLNNQFSFKMTSNLDSRGLMAIPLRHDAVMPLATNSDGWAIGVQAQHTTAAAGGFAEFTSNLQTLDSNPAVTLPTKSGVIVPRMNLPTLEQVSWDLNQLKLVGNDASTHAFSVNDPGDKKSYLQPMFQLGGTGQAMNFSGTLNSLQDIVRPYASASRMQDMTWKSLIPYDQHLNNFPKFKTQLTGGSLKMRVVNQAMDRTTVEYVVLKVTDPLVGRQLLDSQDVIAPRSSQFTGDKIWSTLFETVGYEHARKVGMKTSGYPMGAKDQPDVSFNGTTPQGEVKTAQEVITSPYHSWLPSSLFKAKYPVFKPFGTAGAFDAAVTPEQTSSMKPGYLVAEKTTNNENTPFMLPNPALGAGTSAAFNQATVIGSGGQDSPYRVAGRGHCTISAGGERTVTIPLPGVCYDASRIKSAATLHKEQSADDLRCEFSDESFIVLMSINGALTDMLLNGTGADADNVKVIGKAYAPSTVDVYCSYTENVAPVHCDYSQIPNTVYNMGNILNPMLPGDTDAYPGRVLSMAGIQPISTNGIVRTGNTGRAADN